MRTRTLILLLAIAGLAGAAYETGLIPTLKEKAHDASPSLSTAGVAPPPAVSAAPAAPADFIETALVTGSLVPREEILVAPEVEGLRVLELKADEGDRVKRGDVLAVLVSEQLDAQIAQNDASLARSEAGIAQARSKIVEADARLAESNAALERARPLVNSKYLAESVFDQRDAAAKTAAAQLIAANDGLKLAEAEKAQVEAQRRELNWRRGNTEVRAPSDGIVSRRAARTGSIAVGAFVAGGGEPLFRIIARGEIELDAEVTETRLAKIKAGQHAKVDAAGAGVVLGTVRLVSPEVDKASRLGRVRIFLGDNPALRIGAFARATIETARARNLAVPQSAILYGERGATVQVVVDGKVATRRIETGLSAASQVEVLSGLVEGDLVVTRAGTFLRDGDTVRTVLPDAKVSEVGR
jgi:RND family efflux transporter MFP subunit